MKPREERLEVVRQELAVEDEARLLEPEQRLDDLGEVARERALVAAPQVELVAVPEGEAAEAVPLGLVEVAVERQLACQPRQHRRDRRRDRHPVVFSATPMRYSPSAMAGAPTCAGAAWWRVRRSAAPIVAAATAKSAPTRKDAW